MFTKRQVRILELMVKNSSGIVGSDIADILNVSSRTVRNDISAINNLFRDKEYKINSSKKKGYFLESDHVEILRELINPAENNKSSYVESDDRIFKIFGQLLFEGEQNYFDIGEYFYISEQTVYKECTKLKKLLIKKYNFDYIKVQSDSIIHNAPEEVVRELLFKILKEVILSNKLSNLIYIEYLLNYNFDQNEYKLLTMRIKKFFAAHKITIDDKSLEMVIGSVYIVIVRNRYGFNINNINAEMKNINLVNMLIEELTTCGFELSSNDKYCLSKFLWSIKISKDISNTEEVSTITAAIINDFCKDVMDKYNFDLKESEEIVQYLTIHVEYMIRRIETGYELSNPMLDDIKKKYPLAYEIAMLIVHIIYKYTNKYPLDDEISYIAVYVEYYLHEINSKLKTVIINDSSMGMNNIVRSWLSTNFTNQLEIVDYISLHSLEEYINTNKVDLIVSVREIGMDVNIPSYVIEGIPYKSDYDLLNGVIHKIKINHRYENIIKRMFNNEFINFYHGSQTFDSVITDMAKNLEANNRINNAEIFIEDVLQREKFYPTIIGKQFAIPHPLTTFANKTTVSVALLDKPILHNGKEVRLIFLLAIENRLDDDVNILFQFFKQISLNKDILKELIYIKNKEEFYKKIIYLAKNMQ